MEDENYSNTEVFNNNNNITPEKNNIKLNSLNNNNNFEHNSNVQNNNNNEKVIWDLEIWKKAEQVKFKAYLKQLEYEFINKLTDQFRIKEEERDKEIKNKINEINLLQSRLKKKATELETRENKLSLMEEELKIKINEVARQLANKEEEITYIKKRFKEEKSAIEKDMMHMQKITNEKNKEIEKVEINFKNYKKEIDDSPVSLLKAELTRKALEIDDHIREKERLNQEKEKLKSQGEKLKLDILKIKKLFEQEKEAMYKQRLDEIVIIFLVVLKFYIYFKSLFSLIYLVIVLILY